MSSIERRKFVFAVVMDADFPGTIAATWAIPFRDQNWFAFSFSDWDTASGPFAKPDEQSYLDASDDDCRLMAHDSDAYCACSAPQNPIPLTAD